MPRNKLKLQPKTGKITKTNNQNQDLQSRISQWNSFIWWKAVTNHKILSLDASHPWTSPPWSHVSPANWGYEWFILIIFVSVSPATGCADDCLLPSSRLYFSHQLYQIWDEIIANNIQSPRANEMFIFVAGSMAFVIILCSPANKGSSNNKMLNYSRSTSSPLLVAEYLKIMLIQGLRQGQTYSQTRWTMMRWRMMPVKLTWTTSTIMIAFTSGI